MRPGPIPRALLTALLTILPMTGAYTQPVDRESLSAAQVRARLGQLGLVQQTVFPRPDGLHPVRVMLSQPVAPPPAGGWPVVYMLDGNAAMLALADAHRADLAAKAVLVGIGYEGDKRFDFAARAYDYTPAPPTDKAADAADPRRSDRRNGGAAAWRAFIDREIRPWVARQAPIDALRQTLYGHSYGGLFVLDTLFSAPASFQHYVAASPSLWWHAPYMANRARDFLATPPHAAATLHIMVGTDERRRDGAPGGTSPRLSSDAARPAGLDARAYARLLQSRRDLTVHFREFPGLGHGPMLPASVQAAVEEAVGP